MLVNEESALAKSLGRDALERHFDSTPAHCAGGTPDRSEVSQTYRRRRVVSKEIRDLLSPISGKIAFKGAETTLDAVLLLLFA